MRLGQSYVSAHKYVQLNGVAIADASGFQVMGLNDIGLGSSYAHDFVFDLIR